MTSVSPAGDDRRRTGRHEEDPAAAAAVAAREGDEAVLPRPSRSPEDRVSWGGREEQERDVGVRVRRKKERGAETSSRASPCSRSS